MSRLILLNKPMNVLSQFTDRENRKTLSHYIDESEVYPAGRLDYDSEGLLLLTDDGKIQAQISNPRFKMPKTYWVQVEGKITDKAINLLESGVMLKDGPTKPAHASRIEPPAVWERVPPVRQRASIPTSWIALTIFEGRNRQVRRMTAATGFPTLRLIRYSIGPWSIDGLAPGEWRTEAIHAVAEKPSPHTVKARSRPRGKVIGRIRQKHNQPNQRKGKHSGKP